MGLLHRHQWEVIATTYALRNQLDAAISDCVKVVSEADPSGYSETQFKDVLAVMGRVIDALEDYFTKHGSPKDVAQCYFLGHALKSLKDSRRWIAQGLSPNPEKRPSPAERQRMSDDLSAEMFGGLEPA